MTAARQGICSGKLHSLVYPGKMEGTPEKKWHHTVLVLWIASRQQDRPVSAHSTLHSRGNWGSTAASEVRVTPQRLCQRILFTAIKISSHCRGVYPLKPVAIRTPVSAPDFTGVNAELSEIAWSRSHPDAVAG